MLNITLLIIDHTQNGLAKSLLYLDPRTKQCETEVQKIMHLQEIGNQLSDAFTDTKRVTKSYTSCESIRIEVPIGQINDRH